MLDVVIPAVEGGVNLVQLREKEMAHENRVALAREIKSAIQGQAELLINADVKAVIEADADGIHLPEDGGDILAIRERIGDQRLISQANHGDHAKSWAAECADVDLLVFGTVFATASKPGADPAGLDSLDDLGVGVIHTPYIAIGGITVDNIDDVAPRAAGVAVIGAIFDDNDPRAVASKLWKSLCDARPEWCS